VLSIQLRSDDQVINGIIKQENIDNQVLNGMIKEEIKIGYKLNLHHSTYNIIFLYNFD